MSLPSSGPVDRAFATLVEGTRASRDYVVSADVHGGFLDAFGDVNPMHVDRAFAIAAGFEDVVVHGAILNGFLSHFVGMELPGRRALLLAADVRYLAASHVGDTIRIDGEIQQRSESQATVVLAVTFENVTRGRTVARGRVHVRVSGGG